MVPFITLYNFPCLSFSFVWFYHIRDVHSLMLCFMALCINHDNIFCHVSQFYYFSLRWYVTVNWNFWLWKWVSIRNILHEYFNGILRQCGPSSLLNQTCYASVMEAFYHITGPLWRETIIHGGFHHKEPIKVSFYVVFVLSQNKLMKKQSSCQWFETSLEDKAPE